MGFRESNSRTSLHRVFTSIGLISTCALAAGWLWASETVSSGDQFRSLVKVLAQRESIGILHEGRLILEPRVREINLFNGVVTDSRGYVISYVGNKWQQLEAPDVEFWLERVDGKRFPARLVGVDERLSLALVQSSGVAGRSIAFGSSLGQNEYNFVSFQENEWGSSPLHILRLNQQKDLPELQASICKVASSKQKYAVEGSLILDSAGRFLGIVTEREDHQFSRKINAVQVLTVESVRASQAEILEANGNVRAGWLGVFLDPESPDITVTSTLTSSPADKAGLKPGDKILQLDGRRIESAQEFARSIRWKRPGSQVALKVERQGKRKELSAALSGRSGRPSQLAWAIQIPKVWNQGEKSGGEIRLYQAPLPTPLNIGFVAEPLTPQLAKYFKAPYRSGLLVKSVVEKSPAGIVGFQAGDILLQVNGKKMTAPEDLKSVIEKSEDGILVIKYLRDAQVRTQKIVLQ